MININKQWMLATCLSATVMSVALPGKATAQSEQADQGGSAALEDIVVTADRSGTKAVQVGSFRGARQLDVPLTVSVLPKELIESQQSLSLLDALKNTAGVSVSQISTLVYSPLAIRGIDVENRGNYRLDGALPVINLVGLPLEDKERVEALKGASALYYGFTAPSGIINMVMERPTPEQKISLKLSGSSVGAYLGAADYGNTWGDGLFGARLNAVYARIDAGIDHSAGHRSLLSGAFDLKPSDSLTVTLDVERIYTNAGEPGLYRYNTKPVTTVGNPNPTVALPALRRNSLNFGPGDWARTRGNETNVLLSARYKISPSWELTASAGASDFTRYRRLSFIDIGRPLGGDNYTLTVGNAPRDSYLNRNIRAELAGVIAFGIIKNNILIGVSQNIRDRDNPTTINATFTQNLINPLQFPEVPFALPNYGTNNSRNSRINDKGIYIFDRTSFGEFLDILGGIRFSDYRESIRFGNSTTFKATPTSYSVGAVGKPTKWASIYGTFIEGLETTPAAPFTAVNASEALPPTQSRQYEAGVKIEPQEGLLLQAGYFNIRRDAAFVNGANFYVLDGKQTYKGVELSATGKVTRDLSIYATALFLNAKYTSGAATALSTNAAGVPTYLNGSSCTTTVPAANAASLRCVSTTIVGNRVDNAPKNTISIAVDYALTDLIPGLSVNAAAYHTGSRAVNAANIVFAPAYTIYNVGAGYTTEIGGAETTFRASWENIGNKRYWATAGLDFLAQGVPSAVKVSVTTNF